MQVRLLLGPAGSGKTFRCVTEARQALADSCQGPPLLLLAPKQGTYQLEQQLVSTPALAGYTRLFIVSFESLARLVFEQLGRPIPQLLSEEGRVMVLRALLADKREQLKLFRASARLTGFAQQLSELLGELQRRQLTPKALKQLAGQLSQLGGLSYKLEDLASLLEHYLNWLAVHQLQDHEALLRTASDLLRSPTAPSWVIGGLWVDGFAEFTELELELLCALLPRCQGAVITFCLAESPAPKHSWLSHWSMVRKNFEICAKRIRELPKAELVTEFLRRNGSQTRFSKNTVLQHLEQAWAEPLPYAQEMDSTGTIVTDLEAAPTLRLVSARDREGEASMAAREIIKFVRAGARYRDVSVVVRNLELYQQPIQRIFSRYEIPFFLDRRESVSHHPLAELTRGAVRAAAFGWQHADWFAALKSGLVPAEEQDIDVLENEALARGWRGRVWREPIELKDVPKTDQERERLDRLQERLERIRCAVVPPFEQFHLALSALGHRPSGQELAGAVRELWTGLGVQERLGRWAASERGSPERPAGHSVHETVWRQMNEWLDSAALAFPRERLTVREWLPILEAGLANLTIGIIPPALDQVLVGAIDRSRTPEVKLALVLGLNETVFPATTTPPGLLTESDRLELEKCNVLLGTSVRRRIGQEKYLAYIACTRPCQRLVLSWAARDPNGAPLNPSSLVSHVRRLFPQLQPEVFLAPLDWRQVEHRGELCALLPQPAVPALPLAQPESKDTLQPESARLLYGPVLRTSVSRMEQFAACPFKFFVHSGLRAEERQLFDLDVKEQGSFQHDVLAHFHNQLRAEGKRWRDITPVEARRRVASIGSTLSASFRDGLLQSNAQAKFTARVLTESLQDFVETLVTWMHQQYRFDPIHVELPFGEDGGAPAWSLDLGGAKRLELYGRIDRVDLYPRPGCDSAWCVVVDYKSSQKQLDPLLVQHGLQLQLLTYLTVLRQWPDSAKAFGVSHLEPAGVFYVNLRGKYDPEPNRRVALAQPDRARKLAYRHTGRFDLSALPLLDDRPGVSEGDQFNYRLTKGGQLHGGCKEPVTSAEFDALLKRVEQNLITMGQQIYSGRAEADPYRKGAVTACDQCAYASICRVDLWTTSYRVLRPEYPKVTTAAR